MLLAANSDAPIHARKGVISVSEKYNPETTPGSKVLKDDTKKRLGQLALDKDRRDKAAKNIGGTALNDKNKK